ncbi:SusE domain-containing protein [Psychroserpens ponticola]|uniref:SusE domain-containing protein n=1 Tax=Psychroserpens ponticola TaxID=2932268 RepID=A0ABY7RW01_9FLAO|nr:SusE domain-containing protein [Psychroserpens ponticola]WCO01267.1 SusE domain-containing protein [Psychroserpens ponticola]
MKKILKLVSLFTILIFAVNCDDTEDFEFTTPVESFSIITPGDGVSIILDGSNDQNPALTIVWNDNITGAETYAIEMSIDEEFTNPLTIGNSNSNTFTMSVEGLNSLLLDNDISALEETSIYLRVIGNDSQTSAIRLTVSSYPEENPIITSPDSTFEIVLSDITEDETALTVDWTDPNFSPDSPVVINYNIEIAVAGTDFATVESLGDTQDRTLSFTHSELNAAALNLGLQAETVSMLDLRVRSVLETTSGDLERNSDLITITVTPHEAGFPSVLYAVGAGLPDAGWGWGSPEEFISQGSIYSANVNLSPDNGGNFRFFAQQDWGPIGYNYPWFEARGYTIDADLINANDGDSNFQFIGTAGEYSLEIDTENKTLTLGNPTVGSNCEYDQLWLVGAGVPDAGWGWASPVQLPCTGSGVYAGNVNLANDSFRFFTDSALEWASPSFNYPYYTNEGYTIDSNFADAMDGDNNFSFTGTPGEYFLTVDTINQTITLGSPQTNCEYDQLWLVGAGVPDAGWAWTTPVQLPCTGDGVYSGSVTFANDSFRFFTDSALEWDSPSFNYPYYVSEGFTIDPNFEDALDGDNNFSFTGAPGTYTLTVDTVNMSITLN